MNGAIMMVIGLSNLLMVGAIVFLGLVALVPIIVALVFTALAVFLKGLYFVLSANGYDTAATIACGLSGALIGAAITPLFTAIALTWSLFAFFAGWVAQTIGGLVAGLGAVYGCL